jgi:hypothetical protein
VHTGRRRRFWTSLAWTCFGEEIWKTQIILYFTLLYFILLYFTLLSTFLKLRRSDVPWILRSISTRLIIQSLLCYNFSLCLFQASDFFFLLMDPLDIW